MTVDEQAHRRASAETIRKMGEALDRMTDYTKLAEGALRILRGHDPDVKRGDIEVGALARALLACDRERQELTKQRDLLVAALDESVRERQSYRDALEQIEAYLADKTGDEVEASVVYKIARDARAAWDARAASQETPDD